MTLSYLPEFQAILTYVQRTKDWVVIVTAPDSPCAQGFRQYGLGMFPVGTQWAGRTAQVASGGRITLIELGHGFEHPEQVSVIFLGFDHVDPKNQSQNDVAMATWRKQARQVLTVGGIPETVQVY